MVSNRRPHLAMFLMVLFSGHVAAAAALSDCPKLVFDVYPHAEPLNPEQTSATSVSVTLQPALLRPQLEQLLATQWNVQHLVWNAAPEHYWPSHYRMTAANQSALLEKLLIPYRLRVTFHHNHTAVVDYLPGGVQ